MSHDRRANSAVAPRPRPCSGMSRFRDWLRAEQGVELADYDALWQWSVADLPAFWSAVAGFFGVRFHVRLLLGAGLDGHAGRDLVPRRDAELRRTGAHRAGPTTREAVVLPPRGRQDGTADVLVAACPGRRRPSRPGVPGRRQRRPSRRSGAQLAGHARRVPGRGQPRRHLVVVLAGLRCARGVRPVHPDRADGAHRGRRLRLQRPRRSTSAPRSSGSARRSRA